MKIKAADLLKDVNLQVVAVDYHDLTILYVWKGQFQFRMWWSKPKGRVFRDKGPFSITNLLDPTGPGYPAYIIPNKVCATAYKVAAINLDPRLNTQLLLL